jgi:peptidoglycan/LPS O-acetylase OafA/YrhL
VPRGLRDDRAAMSAAGPLAGASDAERRDPRLDGLRGLAILLVMLFHMTRFELAQRPAGIALSAVPLMGWSGVDLFFVLSGFLITGILLRTKESPGYYRTFYARRALRIFPLYYAVLTFFTLIAPHVALSSGGRPFVLAPPLQGAAWYWLYLSNVRIAWIGHTQSLVDVSWSLAIEEHFYLIWPWVVRRCDARRLLAICAATAAGALALRAACIAAGANPLVAYVLTPCRLDTLATGAALAVVAARATSRSGGGLAVLARPARLALPAAAAAFVACWAYLRFSAAGAPSDATAATEALSLTTRPLMQTAGYTLLCVAYGALLVWVATAPAGSRRARCFELGALRQLGKYSYALYLLHFPVATLVLQLFPRELYLRAFVPAQLLVWALAIGASYALARLSWALLEEPMLRLKRHFPYRL